MNRGNKKPSLENQYSDYTKKESSWNAKSVSENLKKNMTFEWSQSISFKIVNNFKSKSNIFAVLEKTTWYYLSQVKVHTALVKTYYFIYPQFNAYRMAFHFYDGHIKNSFTSAMGGLKNRLSS